MSRIGLSPVLVPSTVTIDLVDTTATVKGPKGSIVREIPEGVAIVSEKPGVYTVSIKVKNSRTKALHGFVRAQLANDVQGVSSGWTRQLELSGVGYRASMNGVNLVLNVGFSHQVTIVPPVGIQLSVNEGKIVVSGIDKQVVGQCAANIRLVKVPEPYKGKGIKYTGERIRKKAGKSAKAVGGAAGAK